MISKASELIIKVIHAPSPSKKEMAMSLREHPLWKDDGEEDFNWAVEALEKYIIWYELQ